MILQMIRQSSSFWDIEYQEMELIDVLKAVFIRIELARNYSIPNEIKINIYKELIKASYELKQLELCIDWLIAGKVYPSGRMIALEDFYMFKESAFVPSSNLIPVEEVKTMLKLNTKNTISELELKILTRVEDEFNFKFSENELMKSNNALTEKLLYCFKTNNSQTKELEALRIFKKNIESKLKTLYDEKTVSEICNCIQLSRTYQNNVQKVEINEEFKEVLNAENC